MDDANRDSQDSETNSTSSWILLESPVENQLLQVDNLKNHSDIESDGSISILSEFSHDEKSSTDDEDEVETTAVSSEKETTILSNDIETVQEIIEDEVAAEDENKPNENEGIENVEDIQENNLELAQVDDSPTNSMGNVNYDYQKFITWPSLICTSVVIFAVLIFPYFSSEVDDPNNLSQQNLDQYDVNLLKDSKITDIDPYIYCKEIVRESSSSNNLQRDFNMKKCIKKVFKHIKKAKKNQVAREINFLDKEIDKETNKYQIENKEVEINYKKMYKKQNNEEFTSRKYTRKLKYDNVDINKKTFRRNDEFNYENEQIGKQARKNKWNLAHEEVTSSKETITDHANFVINDKGNSKFSYQTKENNGKFEKSWQYHQNQKDDDNEMNELEKKRISLEKKEAKLREWETKLIEKEKKLELKLKKVERENAPEHQNEEPKLKKFKKNDHFLKENNINDKLKKNVPNEKFFKIQNISKKNKTRILDDDNVTITGDWYLNLVRARQDTRKKEEKASWWFDRAEFRRNKRNKAFWYFQYMFNRENLRYRPKNI